MASLSISVVSASAPDGGPLTITLLSSSSKPGKPLHPATHLQLHWVFPEANGVDMFTDGIPVASLTAVAGEEVHDEGSGGDTHSTYTMVVPRSGMPAACTPPGADGLAVITLLAWRGEKLLGQWPAGEVKGLGQEQD